MQTVVIPKVSQGRANAVERFAKVLCALDPEKAFEVVTREKKPRRTDSQNALLWSLYTEIIRMGGEAMQGYTKEDLHEFFLGNHFGWKIKTIFGRKKQAPACRSSRLNKQEFSDLVDSIVRFMAERGVVLSMPGDL